MVGAACPRILPEGPPAPSIRLPRASMTISSTWPISVCTDGKSPMIIFDDADIDNALNAALVANFYSTGQVCSNGTRVFVQSAMHDEFVERLAERTQAIRVGDPFDPETQMGPLVSREHFEKVCSYMATAKKSGARHVCGGDVISD